MSFDGYKTHDPVLLFLDKIRHNWEEAHYWKDKDSEKCFYHLGFFYGGLKGLLEEEGTIIQSFLLCSQGVEGGSGNSNPDSSSS